MSTQVKKLLQDAISAHQQGNLKKADTLYSKILSRDRRHAEATHMRGVLKLAQGNHEYAKRLLADAEKLEPGNPLVSYHQGDLHRVIGEFATAEKFFKANCYEKLDTPDKALEHLLLVSSVDNSLSIELQLIKLLAQTGNVLKVSERISHLPAPTDDKIEIKQLLQTTNTLLEADRAEDASRLLDIATTLDTGNESQETLALFTGLLVNVGRYQDARKVLDEASSRFKRNAISWFQLGLCEQTSGTFDKAASCHRKALECETNFGRAAYSLAINGKSAVTDKELKDWQEQSGVESNGEAAFTDYQNANEMHHARDPFDPDRWDAYIDSVIENFSSDYFNKTKSMGKGGEGLVFIVGMPRSGSTLLEYQLARQFAATALGEHPTIRRLFMDLPYITNENRPVPQCPGLCSATQQ